MCSLSHRSAHLLLQLLREVFERLIGIAIEHEGEIWLPMHRC